MELETSDPMVALAAKSIHERCAAARDLSKVGVLDSIPALAERAARDKSPAVRLCAAGAAADILSRFRLGDARAGLADDRRAEILDLFRAIDPSNNAGLFPMLACLDLPVSFRRISSGLRDPRGDVRVGAGVGMLRLCISHSRLGDEQLESDVVGLLSDRRLKTDALAEVARVCAAAGFASGLPVLLGLDLGTSAQAEMVTELVDIMEQWRLPAIGLWWSDGLDAGEVASTPPLSPALRVGLPDGTAHIFVDGDGWTDGAQSRPSRRMLFRRVGQPAAGAALQSGGRTWYQVAAGEVADFVDVAFAVQQIDWSANAAPQPGVAQVAQALIPTLGENGDDERLRAILAQRSGNAADALTALERAVESKKVAADTWFFLGEARAAAGDAAGARKAWRAAVKKAKRKIDWQVARANARLGK